MSVVLDSKTTCVLHFPNEFLLTQEIATLQNENPHLIFKVFSNTSLEIIDKEDTGKIQLRIPQLEENFFLQLRDLNSELNLEYDGEKEITIKMGVFRLIGKLTARIVSSFVAWASSTKQGEVYADPTEYEIQKEGKKIRRIPDVSYISYETASEEVQNSWMGFIPIPPNMALEIVSSKNGLKQDLKKMEEVWIPLGVDVGIVVCPFTEKIYIFEKGKAGYTTQSIYEDFSHPFLKNYKENFGKYLK